MAKSLVSVILPCYNAEDFLKDSIDSILSQTYPNFELIIINDGSTDNTLSIIKKYKDSRIRVVSRENRGLVSSLNEGIELASGSLIARQDADDISMPDRFEKQVEHFEKNLKLVLLGSSMKTMNMDGKIINTHHLITGNQSLCMELLIRSPFAHGSVMFRKKAFERCGKYSKKEWPAEDYGLWLRMSEFGDIDNIKEPLYIYRENSEGISAKNKEEQVLKTKISRNLAWKYRGRLIKSSYKPEEQENESVKLRQLNNYLDIYRMSLIKFSPIIFIKLTLIGILNIRYLRYVVGTIYRRCLKILNLR